VKTDVRKLKKVIEDLLTFSNQNGKDLSIFFVDNRRIQKLNNRFFGRDRPTNVVSFSYMGGFDSEVIGDIIVSVEKAAEEARDLMVPTDERIIALVIHGLLHILGFDHEQDPKEARRMRYREKKLLAWATSHPFYAKTG
jgi:rRNA maturation RNase YbeY